jgi:transposase-like protein
MVEVDAKPVQWQDLTGEQRWQVIEQARRGQIQITDLCRTFGITRQTLYRAMATADQAARQALTPSPPGRKKKPANEVQVQALKKELATRQQELDLWRQKYEVTKTLLSLERKLAQGKALPGEQRKKRRGQS